ncbi:MAG: hypothetical protein IKZ34_00005, partial [Alphaproteobacteria bacterium]|nr:hypothetical protein [Alphaproteobacteria bacterium]
KMMHKFFILISFIIAFVMPNATLASAFEMDDYAITDSGDADITQEEVTLNDDADIVDVSTFDIAGIMLGMSFEDLQTLFFKNKGLYIPRKKNSIIYTIHKDWKYNLDYECRNQGSVISNELEKCINSLARSRGLLYASELHLVRENTGETIVVYFTSNASDNRVWRIVYNNDVNEQEGDAEKFERQRENKILAFWQNVLDKYGAPNSGSDKWISSTNAYDPMLTAYYGALDLVDNGRNASDHAKNIQDARENFKAKPYAF